MPREGGLHSTEYTVKLIMKTVNTRNIFGSLLCSGGKPIRFDKYYFCGLTFPLISHRAINIPGTILSVHSFLGLTVNKNVVHKRSGYQIIIALTLTGNFFQPKLFRSKKVENFGQDRTCFTLFWEVRPNVHWSEIRSKFKVAQST